jgi:tetratricopeptide (TPR) repeat protein
MKSKALAITLLVVCGLALYANTWRNQMFWDDNDFILNNQYVRNFDVGKMLSENVIAGSNLVSNYWRPALLTVFSVEWHLWHGHVFGWHLVNTLFHIADAILLFYILKKLFKNNLLAFLTSLIFVIHPLQTEAVAYVNSLGDSLSVFFMFFGLNLFLNFKQLQEPKSNSSSYLWSGVCYVLALMSKETAIIMPGLILLVDFFSQDPQLHFKTRLKQVWQNIYPFFIIAGLYLILRATSLNFQNTFNLYNEQNIFTSNFFIRIFTFFKILVIYLGLLLYPHNLHMERSLDVAKNLWGAPIFGLLITIFILCLIISQYKKRPIISFGLLWFLFGLAPTSNILVPINGLLYEHWLYLPMIGFWLCLFSIFPSPFGGGCPALSKKELGGRGWFYAIIIIFAAYFTFFAATTIARNRQWRDPITFYNQTLQYAPSSYRIINNLGMAYADAQNYTLADQMYNRAISLDDANPVAYHNLANSYKTLGQTAQAVQFYKLAIQKSPEFIFSYNALVQLYLDQNKKNEAVAFLEEIKKTYPNVDYASRLLEQIK